MATLAPSLRLLFNEIDALWPNRNRGIDGWYRDPKVGISKGHNPGARGLVHAIDVDRRGIDPMWIVNQIYRGIHILDYMIWNRVIYDYHKGWVPTAYTLENPHTDHIHIEIFQEVPAEQYSGGWHLAGLSGGAIVGGVAGASGGNFVSQGLSAADDRDPRAHMNTVAVQFNEKAATIRQMTLYNIDTRNL